MLKTVEQYLAAHEGDATRAAQAMHADLTRIAGERDTARSEASTAKASLSDAEGRATSARSDADKLSGQNSSARAFKRVYKATIEALKLPTDDLSDEAGLTEKASAALASMQASGPRTEALSKALTDLGGNPDDLDNSVKTLQGRLARADKADTLERSQAIRDAAESLGYDHAKLSRLTGIDALTQQDVTTDKDGQRVVSKVWGVPGKDDAGKDTFTPLADFAAPFDASLKGQPAQGRQWTPPQQPGGQPAPNPIAAALAPGSANGGQPKTFNLLNPKN